MTLPPYSNLPPDPKPPLTSHRRAAVLMFVIGGLLAVFGLCGFLNTSFQNEQTVRESMASAQKLFGTTDAGYNFAPNTIKNIDAVLAMLMLIAGLALIALGNAVRAGNQSAVWGGIVMSGLFTLVGGLLSLFMAIVGFAAPPAFACACGICIPVALTIVQLIFLITAVRAGSRESQMKAQQALQFMQSQLAAERFGSTGYGYAPPPNAPHSTPPQSTEEKPDHGTSSEG